MILPVHFKYTWISNIRSSITCIWRMCAIVFWTTPFSYIILLTFRNQAHNHKKEEYLSIVNICYLVEGYYYWSGLSFQNLNQTFPSDQYYVFDEEGLWIQSMKFIYHVFHFFESISLPFTIYVDPNYFQGPVSYTSW